jgi:hypothetical protein
MRTVIPQLGKALLHKVAVPGRLGEAAPPKVEGLLRTSISGFQSSGFKYLSAYGIAAV